MGRADAARSEDVVVSLAERVQRVDDRILLVGDDAHFLQVYPRDRQHIGEMADILVLGASGEEFVADGEHGGGYDG